MSLNRSTCEIAFNFRHDNEKLGADKKGVLEKFGFPFLSGGNYISG